jgi:hypothetical protein
MEIPEECERYDEDLYFYVNFKRLNAVAKADCLYAPDIISEDQYRVLFSLRFDDLSIGEKLKIDIETQFSNEMPKPMMLSYYWVLTGTPFDIFGEYGSRPKGENFDNYIIHHKVVKSTGGWEIKDSGTQYANFVAFAASGEKKLENEWIRIDRGYASIFIDRK